ncbi:mitochondrial carrier [Lentinula edodes]|uniref:Mitochondrial carrier n=1 Tax=Lentinula edodes TaxID=5353 RepID=A0A1Q3E1R3_LENED|nr:mitochondrial carrier [Lentinula edodes]
MEFWPEDKQSHVQDKFRRVGKGKGKALPSGTSYLELGRLEAVTLIENKTNLEWISPLRSRGGPKLTPGDSVEVFGPTRPPPVHIPSTSNVHRAEQGANFLRTYFPDIEIAAELVREELSTDAQFTRDLEQYDPFSRNVLELLYMPNLPDTPKFLAFPMGVTGSDLSIYSLNGLGDNNMSFQASSETVKSFTTPVLQLVSSQILANSPNMFLAVRTMGSTTLLRARYTPDFPQADFTELSNITRDDTGERSSVDIKFHSKQSDVLFVNEEGRLYKSGIENGQLRTAYHGIKNYDSADKFQNGVALNLLGIDTTTGEKLTWIEDSEDSYLIPLVSTDRILWLDRRFAGKPLLGIKHGRNYDRTLALRTVIIRGIHHSLMTSRKNKLITVYDVSRSTEQLLHADNAPYSFSVNTRENRFSGDAYVNMGDQYKMFRISERGRLTCVDLKQSGNDITSSFAATQFFPSRTNDIPAMRPDLGPAGAREFSQTNLRPAYEQLFPSIVSIDTQEEKNSEAVYDLLEQLPSFWQQDTPIEQVLTTYDILFRTGDEPGHTSRADFLTETVFNSTRGYRILLQDRLPVQSLMDGASWYSDIAPIMNHFDESTVGNIRSIAERFRSFDLSLSPDHPIQASRRQNKAREQLALDLTLSKDIFSTQRFTQFPRTPTGDCTEASGPSAIVHFHYLQPMPRRDHYSREEQQEDNVNFPCGVGLLLEDWDVGVDPDKYIYNNTYDVKAEPNLETTPKLRVQPVQSQTTLLPSSLSQSQMPPSIAILPVNQPLALPLRVSGVQSQMTEPTEVESQVLMTSTQVLPGPFGGRPTAPARYMDGKRTSDPVYSTAFNDFLGRNKAVVTALSASCISTFAGYPLDSLKSRLQTTKTPISVPRLALTVYRDEGISGFYRGLAIPLLTISFVRAASFTIYNSTKDYFKKREWLVRDSIVDVSIIGGISGAMSGALISVGSTPFELVKVRRQLEYTIASSKGIHLSRAPGTFEAVRDIFRTSGIAGLYTGFRLHFTRDTTGTMLYFLEYDGMRYLLGRQRSGEQGPIPAGLPIPVSLAPFVCGSFAGVTSWALIYPLDVVKTKVQQRALAGERYRGPFETFHRLIRGPDPNKPKPFLAGVARIYRGLGVSALA